MPRLFKNGEVLLASRGVWEVGVLMLGEIGFVAIPKKLAALLLWWKTMMAEAFAIFGLPRFGAGSSKSRSFGIHAYSP